MQKQTAKTLCTKELVKRLLIDKPETRDDDPLLYVLVLHYKGYEKMPVYELLTRLPYQSVTRFRRLWQDEMPELIGEKEEERQRRKQKTKQDMKPNYWSKLKRLFNK